MICHLMTKHLTPTWRQIKTLIRLLMFVFLLVNVHQMLLNIIHRISRYSWKSNPENMCLWKITKLVMQNHLNFGIDLLYLQWRMKTTSVIIKNFATCRSCYKTYIYTHGSTKSLNSHKCSKEPSSTSSSPSFRYFNYYLFTIYFAYISSIKSSLNSKTNQFSSEKKKTLTSSLAKWICQSMRPISIVEDEGFLNIIQQFLRWNGGERYPFKPWIIIHHSTPAEGKKNTQKSESISNALFVRFLEWAPLLIYTSR